MGGDWGLGFSTEKEKWKKTTHGSEGVGVVGGGKTANPSCEGTTRRLSTVSRNTYRPLRLQRGEKEPTRGNSAKAFPSAAEKVVSEGGRLQEGKPALLGARSVKGEVSLKKNKQDSAHPQ